MGTIIVSDKDKEYHEFVLGMLEMFEKYNIHSVAVVALTDTDNISGYWNMDLYDRLKAKNEIELDCIDRFIMNNKDRYFEEE